MWNSTLIPKQLRQSLPVVDNLSLSCCSLMQITHQPIQHDWEVKIQHSYLEANKCVDVLVVNGCDHK
jgi:hypothetical protein